MSHSSMEFAPNMIVVTPAAAAAASSSSTTTHSHQENATTSPLSTSSHIDAPNPSANVGQLQAFKHQLESIPAFSYVGSLLRVSYFNPTLSKEPASPLLPSPTTRRIDQNPSSAQTTTTPPPPISSPLASQNASDRIVRIQGYLSNVTPEHLILHHCNRIVVDSPTVVVPNDNNKNNNNASNNRNCRFLDKIPNACLLRKNIISAEPVLMLLISGEDEKGGQLNQQNQQKHQFQNHLRYERVMHHHSEEMIKTLIRLDLEMIVRKFIIQQTMSMKGCFKHYHMNTKNCTTATIATSAMKQSLETEFVATLLARNETIIQKPSGSANNDDDDDNNNTVVDFPISNELMMSTTLRPLLRATIDEFFQPTVTVKKDGQQYSRFAIIRTELMKNVAKVYRIDSRMINLRTGSGRLLALGGRDDGGGGGGIANANGGATTIAASVRNFFGFGNGSNNNNDGDQQSSIFTSLRRSLFHGIFGDILRDAATARNNNNIITAPNDNNNNNNNPATAPQTDATALNQLFSVLSFEEIRFALRERKNVWYSRTSYSASLLALASAALLAYSGFTYISLSGSDKILEDYMYGARLASILLGAGGLLLVCFQGWEMMLLTEMNPTGLVRWARQLNALGLFGGLIYAMIVIGGILRRDSSENLSGEPGFSRTLLDVYTRNSNSASMCSYFSSNRCAGFDRACRAGTGGISITVTTAAPSTDFSPCPATCTWNELYTTTCKGVMEATIFQLAEPTMVLLGIVMFAFLLSTIFHLCFEFLVNEIRELTRAVEGDVIVAADDEVFE